MKIPTIVMLPMERRKICILKMILFGVVYLKVMKYQLISVLCHIQYTNSTTNHLTTKINFPTEPIKTSTTTLTTSTSTTTTTEASTTTTSTSSSTTRTSTLTPSSTTISSTPTLQPTVSGGKFHL